MKNWNICPMTYISTQKRVFVLKPTVWLRCLSSSDMLLKHNNGTFMIWVDPVNGLFSPFMEVLQIIGLYTFSISIPSLCVHLAFDWWSLQLINNWQQSLMNVVLIIMWNGRTAIHLECIVNTLRWDSMSTIFAQDLSRPFSGVPV